MIHNHRQIILDFSVQTQQLLQPQEETQVIMAAYHFQFSIHGNRMSNATPLGLYLCCNSPFTARNKLCISPHHKIASPQVQLSQLVSKDAGHCLSSIWTIWKPTTFLELIFTKGHFSTICFLAVELCISRCSFRFVF